MVWGMEAFIWHQQQVQIRSNWPGRGDNVTPNLASQTTAASPTFGTTRHTPQPRAAATHGCPDPEEAAAGAIPVQRVNCWLEFRILKCMLTTR